MPLDQSTLDAVANSNYKNLGEANTLAYVQQVQSQNAHQSRLQILAETALARSLRQLSGVDIEQAAADQKVDGGQAGLMAQLGSAVAALQQVMKGAQSTPPETATTK